ncbi:MAG: hypothetical protein MZV63_21875 [Marinilabiliales bacterium]|nr:hypothetical protein [Marinilabiliales bacterium]
MKRHEFAGCQRLTEEEKSLRFNMVTVLFADIHGFSKLVEGYGLCPGDG